jgi:TonB family protein
MLGETEQPQINLAGLDASSGHRRRRGMFLGLVLVLTALGLFVVRYRAYWFDALLTDQVADQSPAQAAKETGPPAPPAHARKVKPAVPSSAAAPALATAATPEPREVVLAPLRVDVTYAGGLHQTLLARNSAVQVNMDRDADQPIAMPVLPAETGAVKATETVRFSPQTVEVVVRPVEPQYPLLAQQSHVQGSVVLHARINKDGTVQSLQVVSGPDILTTAALEAVKQWRFKPHYEDGQAVPTETSITVNFSISTP